MSDPQIILQHALPTDAPHIWAVRTRAIRHGCRNHYSEQEIEAWASVSIPETFPDLIARQQFVVAVLCSRVVGFAALKAETKEVDAIFVCPDFAGQGLGHRLLTYLEMLARSLDIGALTLQAWLNSVAFYQAAGYIAGTQGWHINASGLKLPSLNFHRH